MESGKPKVISPGAEKAAEKKKDRYTIVTISATRPGFEQKIVFRLPSNHYFFLDIRKKGSGYEKEN